MIDLRRLRAFVVVAEEGHITRAAERLGMSQPPLTRLLRGLETELGTLLLDRLPRGVALTAAGETLLHEARAVLDRAATVADSVRRSGRGEQGRLAIGFTPSAALHPFVPATIRAFAEAWPDVRVELDEGATAELADALSHRRLEAAFVRSPVGGMPDLTVDAVAEEPMVVALPAGHRLAASPNQPLPLAALAAEPFILYRRPAGPGLYDTIVAACRASGFTPRVAQEAPRLPATLSLVAAGLGISVVPASMRRMALDGVVYRAIDDGAGLSAPLHLAFPRGGLSPTAVRFRSMVRQRAAREAA